MTELQGDIAWAICRQGAFQRSRIYKRNISENDKEKFRRELKEYLYLNLFLRYYNKKIGEEILYKLLDDITKRFSRRYSDILSDGKFKYGNAQKFVNLYLKTMWICGFLKTPPHFPIDRIIQGQLGIIYNWTNLTRKQYKEIISKAKIVSFQSGYKSLAEWEAHTYLSLIE